MGLNIKNVEVERLAAEVAAMTGESKTEAIRKALADRRDLLTIPRRQRCDGLIEWLETEVWPNTLPEFRGKPMTKADWDALNDE
jgi:antitoxin VapB